MCPCPGCILALVSWLTPIAQRLALHSVAVALAAASSLSVGAAVQPAAPVTSTVRAAAVTTTQRAEHRLGIAAMNRSLESEIVGTASAALQVPVSNTFKRTDSLQKATRQEIERAKNLISLP